MKNNNHANLYVEYIGYKGSDLCKQIMSRAYVFLAIDILIFISHAAFLSIDMGMLGEGRSPSFMHTVAHMLSLALLIACMFLQINLYGNISSCTSITNLRTTLSRLMDAVQADDLETIAAVTKENVLQDLLNLEEATKKSSQLLNIVEFFTCAAACLLFLIPI